LCARRRHQETLLKLAYWTVKAQRAFNAQEKEMIIYGSRMYFKKNVVRSYGECEHCGGFGQQVSYKARKFGHIYFIPLIPMGAYSQVLRECKQCSMGAHIPDSELETLTRGLSEQFKGWITAITEGEREIAPAPDEEPLNIGALVGSSLSDLYCLQEIENADGITQVMEASDMKMEKELVQGRWQELQGNLQQARQHFDAAHRNDPDSVYPLYHLGLTEIRLGNIPAAEIAFQKQLAIEPDDMSVYSVLAGVYESTKNFPKIIETYDKIYDLVPQTVADKGMKKVYKKACKKAKIQGKYLAQM